MSETLKFNVQSCTVSTRFTRGGQVLIFTGPAKTLELLVSPQQMSQFRAQPEPPTALEEEMEEEEEEEE